MRPARRTVLTALAAGAGAVLAGAAPASAAPVPIPLPAGSRVAEALKRLEREHGARLGVYALDTGTGRAVTHRADELFPMCSLFKTLAAAAVLRDLDHDGSVLARRIHYTLDDVERSGISEWTKRPENLANGLTIGELCEVSITYSDNTAANLLLRELGGPSAVTRFARSLGDRVTRLDRWEPELNSAEPERVTDTTTPRAIGRTYARLVLGDALARPDRELLTRWLCANTTSSERFRKGLPAGWRLGDKTGGGSHGTNNDVGIAWRPAGAPLVLAVLTTKPAQDADADNALVARTAALLAEAFGGPHGSADR
ncbi:beta-lactamase class A [Streptomyces sp. 3211.6]|uniref:class A beta-lactamase n=1 Tax=Streptomyces TaxID=1883 RepID=UPI000CAF3621|nr:MULTISPECIES: class A beta-lactamase [Streptomyces]RKT02451.1 beta-lactamase class A [Streptomyces sp. 3211.6]RPF43771.1 beta-lactamase class A [Streptomyces sp. Ag109_G2-6]